MGAIRKIGAWLLLLAALAAASRARAEDGYELWLRYHALPASLRAAYLAQAHALNGPDDAARAELARGLAGLLGSTPSLVHTIATDGTLVLGTPGSSALVARFAGDLSGLPAEGYLIRSVRIDGHHILLLAANDLAGEVYAAFHFLRLVQTRQDTRHLDIREAPRVHLRMLDHWDNLDGTVERGYAGASLWDWQRLPDYLPPRYTDYARACASVGLNATLLTNVTLTRRFWVRGICARWLRLLAYSGATAYACSWLPASTRRSSSAGSPPRIPPTLRYIAGGRTRWRKSTG